MRNERLKSNITGVHTRRDAKEICRRWIAAWNRRDLEAVRAMFADDVEFTSLRAAAISGSARVSGTDRLRRYWGAALAGLADLHFVHDDLLQDPLRSIVTVLNFPRLRGAARRAAEICEFDPRSLIARAVALFAALVPPDPQHDPAAPGAAPAGIAD
jgi:ketosteroid isomerase-like protein